MTAFGADQAESVLAQCQAASESIGGAFAKAFDGPFEVRTAPPTPCDLEALPANLAGAGLLFQITLADTPCLGLLAEAETLLPAWCSEPDVAGAEKLNQLGTELAAAMLPAEFTPKLSSVTFNSDLAAALRDAEPVADSVCLPLEIVKADVVAQFLLIWPVTRQIDAPRATPASDPSVASSAPGKLPKHRRLIYRNLEDGIRQLPAYAQSLLRVQVPVTVTLASAKTPVSKVLDMGPGTILQFKKACDSNLTLEVGRQAVAEGEAVKVGDKFGLWITSMTMPGERFWSVNNTSPKRVK